MVSETCLHTPECKLFGLLVARVVQNVYDRADHFHIFLCSFFFEGGLSANTCIDHAE